MSTRGEFHSLFDGVHKEEFEGLHYPMFVRSRSKGMVPELSLCCAENKFALWMKAKGELCV
eukprot:scaffold32708_cov56-Cyclotella_meneghiniana.AAC.1